MITTPLPNITIDADNEVRKPRRMDTPIVAIAGSQGKSTVAWLVSEIAQRSGANVGSWLSTGVYVNDEPLEGELGAWKRVLLGGRVGELDLIIQEMDAPTVLGVGLPPSTYSAAVLTNICGNDAICQNSKIAHRQNAAGRLVLSSLTSDGVKIGNADDPAVLELLQDYPHTSLLFALHRENPVLVSHLKAGGTGAWVIEDEIVFGNLKNTETVSSVSELHSSVGGSLMFQIQNILAAICLSKALGFPIKYIQASVKSFSPDIHRQPGACNIFSYYGSRIIVDSTQRSWPLKMLIRGIKRQPHRRTLVASGCFPEMSLEDVRETGRIIGSLAGVVIIHAEPQQQARLKTINEGLSENSVLPVVVQAKSELKAVERLINAIQPEDIGLILAEDTPMVIDRLHPAPNVSI